MKDDKPKQYFSERHGRGPKADALSYEQIRRLAVSVLDHFRQREYFQEALGYHCVDDGDVPGTLGPDPGAYFLRVLVRDNVWPHWDEVHHGELDGSYFRGPRWMSWSADEMFDIVEVLHDLVSKPLHGRYHDFANCGWHYATFDRNVGQQEYRDELNKVLRLGDPAYEIDGAGIVIEGAPEEFRQLLDAPVPDGTEHDLITRKIDLAVSRFRARGASVDERHAAVRDLADVLEALREDMKAVMLPKDESDLFQIANGFAIRHNNRKQRGDYDRLTWLRWAFYVYLATIHAVLRVRNRGEL